MLEALHEYEQSADGGDRAVTAARLRGQEYLLERRSWFGAPVVVSALAPPL